MVIKQALVIICESVPGLGLLSVIHLHMVRSAILALARLLLTFSSNDMSTFLGPDYLPSFAVEKRS